MTTAVLYFNKAIKAVKLFVFHFYVIQPCANLHNCSVQDKSKHEPDEYVKKKKK